MIFVDSGGWIALLQVTDPHHERARTYYEDKIAGGARFVTTNYVTSETATRQRYDAGLRDALNFRNAVARATDQRTLRVFWVTAEVEREAWGLLERYADIPLSLTDATSAVVARRMKVDEIFSFDADFRALGFTVEPAG